MVLEAHGLAATVGRVHRYHSALRQVCKWGRVRRALFPKQTRSDAFSSIRRRPSRLARAPGHDQTDVGECLRAHAAATRTGRFPGAQRQFAESARTCRGLAALERALGHATWTGNERLFLLHEDEAVCGGQGTSRTRLTRDSAPSPYSPRSC